jgi:hypothetical protein
MAMIDDMSESRIEKAMRLHSEGRILAWRDVEPVREDICFARDPYVRLWRRSHAPRSKFLQNPRGNVRYVR